MPKVSVIIPTYNRNRRLKRAIQSVLDQTYQNFEIIVIDDASTVSPEEIILSFHDSRIKFILHGSNKGGSAARNTGIAASSGEYIAFLDSDDEWLPDKLRIQVLALNEKPANVGAVYTGLTALSQKDNKIVGERHPNASGGLQAELYAGNCIGPLSTLMVRRSIFDKSGLFDENLPSCQDWDLCIRLAGVCHFKVISQALVRYYVHSDSITANPRSKAEGHALIMKKYFSHIRTNKRAYAKQCLTIGHYLFRSGERKHALRYFFRAVITRPFYVKTYPYLFSAVFLGPYYEKLSTIRRGCYVNSLNQ